ncbi:hypothetical protein ACHAWF_015737 [Thalassiosira exigua]
MKAWHPLLDPKWVIAAYLFVGVVFIPTGVVLWNKSNNIIELKTIYESYLEKGPPADINGCEIGESANKMYKENEGDMKPPVLVHYELSNFYQNYRKYVTSLDNSQLFGSLTQTAVSAKDCDPLNVIGGIRINPCGLIANTLFNDVITLKEIRGPDNEVIENAPLVETGIAWQSDLEWKFRQPEGFRSEQCTGCDPTNCEECAECDCFQRDANGQRLWSCDVPTLFEGACFRYYYPNDETTQYLYETYPMVVNPIEGVLNEHFVVWMRTAALPKFRKLYGYIETPIPAGSTLTFQIQANFIVQRLRGAKALVVSDNYIFGGKNHWLGTMFFAVGVFAATLGVLFLAKDLLAPRKLADRRYLKHKED